MSIKVYFAGKISGNNWRERIYSELFRLPDVDDYRHDGRTFPEFPPICEGFTYAGPYFLRCDKYKHCGECYRREGDHGFGASAWGQGGHNSLLCGPEIMSPADVVSKCLTWLDEADAVFCWRDDLTAHGTVAELGYAHGKGIPIWIYRPEWQDADAADWFIDHLAVRRRDGIAVKDAWSDFTAHARDYLHVLTLQRLPYREYLQTDHWKGKRAQALAAAKHRCQLCNDDRGLDVHHRTYERRGCELLTDLTTLCGSCHASFHGRLKLATSRLPSQTARKRK